MSGPGGCAYRVLIPESIQMMVRLIKEIVVLHSDEDVYAMLRECFMDPNETVQKLLDLGIRFHISFVGVCCYLWISWILSTSCEEKKF